MNNKIIYAGGHDLGVVKSTDGGVTWAKTDSGIQGTDIHALALNPLDTNRLYAFSVGNGATIYTLAPDPVNRRSMLAGTKDGIYKTTDEGKNWSKVNE